MKRISARRLVPIIFTRRQLTEPIPPKPPEPSDYVNFRTADGRLFRTADGRILRVRASAEGV